MAEKNDADLESRSIVIRRTLNVPRELAFEAATIQEFSERVDIDLGFEIADACA